MSKKCNCDGKCGSGCQCNAQDGEKCSKKSENHWAINRYISSTIKGGYDDVKKVV